MKKYYLKMIISIIAAIGIGRQLGLNKKVPWKLKKDMETFKKLTLNHHILMGRKTFESIGKPLPNRINLLVTGNKNINANGCMVFDCSYKAIDFAKANGEKELFVIGGATIYNFFIENDLVDKMYITETNYNGEADTFFPNFDKNNWNISKAEDLEKSENDTCSGKLVFYERKV